MSTSTGKLKLKLRVCNVILIALSVLSICFLAIAPFLTVKVNYKLTAETVEKMIGEEMSNEVDVDEIVGDGIDIGLSLSITPRMLLKSYTVTDTESYIKDEVIAPTVDGIIEDLKPTIKEIAKAAAKAAAKKGIKDSLAKPFKDAFNDENVDVLAKLEEAGINVDEIVDTVFETLTTEGTVFNDKDDPNSVVNVLLTEVNQKGQATINYFKESGMIAEDQQWETITLEDENVNKVISDIEKGLTEAGLIDETGKITDFDSMLGILLDKLTDMSNDNNDSKGQKDEEKKKLASIINPLNRVYAEEESSEEEAESLTDKIKNLIYSYLPDGVEDTISLGFKIAGGVLGLFILTWAFVGLFALLKTIFGSNPGIFTGLICFVSGILQLIIGLALTFGVTALLSGKIDIAVINDLLKNMPSGLSIAILSSVTVPAFCVLAKFILTFIYRPAKRKLKKRLDAE